MEHVQRVPGLCQNLRRVWTKHMARRVMLLLLLLLLSLPALKCHYVLNP
jgi:hypothetical protein